MTTPRRLVVTRHDLAAVLGVGLRTLDRLQAAGVVSPTAKPRRGRVSRYDLTTCVPAMLEHRAKPPAEPGALDPGQERARLLAEQRRKLEAERAVRERELLRSADVESAWAEVVDAHRETLLQLAADLVGAGAITAEQERAVDDVCRARLSAYAARGGDAA